MSPVRLPTLVAVVLLHFTPWASVRPQSTAPIAITHVTVVDVETGVLAADQLVVVRGNRIARVGPGSAAPPAGSVVVDGQGKFLIPGLWDMHVHAAVPVLDELFFPLLLANGITGVREMFSAMPWVRSARARIARSELPGPRMVASGHILDGTPAIWPGSVGVSDAAAARRAVDSLKQAGADFIKVYSRLSREAYFAAAAESKAKGLPFAGHVPTLVTVAEASDAGQKSIEHLTGVPLACSIREAEYLAQLQAAVASPRGWDSAGVTGRGQLGPLLQSQDPERCRALARTLVKNQTWMVPTIAVLKGVAFLNDTTPNLDPRLKYIPAWFRAGWNASDFRFRMLTPADWANRRALYARQLEIVTLLHQEGVSFLAGTDLSNPWVLPGFSLHDELVAFVAAGFTPLEALRTATLLPARYLGSTDSLGTIEAGKRADLVLLRLNPLTDIRNSTSIEAVIANGRLYDRGALDGLMRKAEALARRPPGQ